VLIAAAATLLACGACAPPHAGPPLTEVRVAPPADWITWLPVELAESLGYPQQEGLTLSIAETTALGKGMEALLGRSVDVTAGTLSQSILLAADRRDVRCFVTLFTRAPIALIVAPAMTGQRAHSDPTTTFTNDLVAQP
jgi:ABC-type nitrate/sulfonate/bicarbonate transport system substrate-binding protein